MSNSIDAFIPELWSARVQKLREKMLIAAKIANFEEQAGLSFGDRVHRPTTPDFQVNDYTRNTDVSLQDVTTGDQYMDIDRSKEVSFYVDKLDVKQSKYDVEMEAVRRATYRIKSEMDAHFLGKVLDCDYYTDAEQAGGSAGTPYTPVPSTFSQFISNSKAVLRANDVEDDRPRYFVATPKVTAVIEQTFVGSGFGLADSTLKNGYKGDAYGLKIFESTNVLHTQTVTGSTLVNTDAFTVAGVTFTFATTASAAGDVDLGSSDTEAMANAVLAINGTGTPGATTYIDISAANRKKLKQAGIYATSDGAVLTIYGAGAFTLTENDSTITLGTLTAHCEMGRMGSTDMVVQMNPEVQKNKDPKKSGYNWLIIDLYGVKKFDEGQARSLDCRFAG